MKSIVIILKDASDIGMGWNFLYNLYLGALFFWYESYILIYFLISAYTLTYC
jgi:hypothetical protein